MPVHQQNKNMMCLMYVDDVVWVAPNQQWIQNVLESLTDNLEMMVEGDVMSFLGIQFV